MFCWGGEEGRFRRRGSSTPWQSPSSQSPWDMVLAAEAIGQAGRGVSWWCSLADDLVDIRALLKAARRGWDPSAKPMPFPRGRRLEGRSRLNSQSPWDAKLTGTSKEAFGQDQRRGTGRASGNRGVCHGGILWSRSLTQFPLRGPFLKPDTHMRTHARTRNDDCWPLPRLIEKLERAGPSGQAHDTKRPRDAPAMENGLEVVLDLLPLAVMRYDPYMVGRQSRHEAILYTMARRRDGATATW